MTCAPAPSTPNATFYESFTNLTQFAHEVVQLVAVQVAVRLLSKAILVDDGHARLRAVTRELVAIVDEDRRIGRILLVETERAGGHLATLRRQMLYIVTWLMAMWLDDPEQRAESIWRLSPPRCSPSTSKTART
ncbi:hypothetical protein OHB26_35495 [Nocardia sp. NBC_01503]|uniref:hypothetical protein n=1 Tax=Nocardia sp. NBC_01503 TaxID=2975997 RepID=UPI002E7B1D46|nr:hypothetical protein [Nocardia sp. NBC_01503]WTL32138.1 hypothetical protein OHB26_35495 [Nocardia sp. NBC_01503]